MGRRAMRRKCWEYISGAVGILHQRRSLLWADTAKMGREKHLLTTYYEVGVLSVLTLYVLSHLNLMPTL